MPDDERPDDAAIERRLAAAAEYADARSHLLEREARQARGALE